MYMKRTKKVLDTQQAASRKTTELHGTESHFHYVH